MAPVNLTEVLVVGLGAVGSIYSLILQRSGLVRVSAVARSNYQQVLNHGIQFRSPKFGQIDSWRPDHVYPTVEAAVRQSKKPFSIVLVTTKALPDVHPITNLLYPFLDPSSPYRTAQPCYLLLQNGLGIDRELYLSLQSHGIPNPEAVDIISTALYIACEMDGANVVNHHGMTTDNCLLGVYRHNRYDDADNTPEQASLLARIKDMLIAGGGNATVVNEIQRIKYRKNTINAAWGTLAILSDSATTAFYEPEEVETEMAESLKGIHLEMLTLGRALGFDERSLPEDHPDTICEWWRKIVKEKAEGSGHLPSMLKDYRSGRPFEVEVIVGELIRLARERKVAVPRLQLVYSLLRVVQHRLVLNMTRDLILICLKVEQNLMENNTKQFWFRNVMTDFEPLPTTDDPHNGSIKLVGTAKIRGPRWAQMPLITVAMLGIQIVWSVETAWASPYLHDELGVKKSYVSLVFLAGPISGLIVQPLIGVLADRSTSGLGRRRPYIIGGVILCAFGLLLLGYTRSFSGIFTTEGSNAFRILTITFAIFSIFLIDFSVNAIMSADRTLIVDVLPTEDQPAASAWASKMFGFGSVVGFFLGSAHLPRIFPFLGDTQLKVLSALTVVVLIGTHATATYSVSEQRLIQSDKSTSFVGIFRDIWSNIRTLPYVIQQICIVQFFAWVAWFPILFYMTIYISEIYTLQFDTPTRLQQTEGTRKGNQAMFYQAIIALITSILFPFLTYEKRVVKRWAFIDLPTLWAIGYLVLSVCLLSTFFIQSVAGTTLLTTILGFTWAIGGWAPFALLGEAILSTPASDNVPSRGHSFESIAIIDRRTRTSEEQQFLIGDGEEDAISMKTLGSGHRHSQERGDGANQDDGRHTAMNSDADAESMGTGRVQDPIPQITLHEATDLEASDLPNPQRAENIADRAGIILGIHNLFIVMPQFLSSLISSIVFAIFDPRRSLSPKPHPSAPGHVPDPDAHIPSSASTSLPSPAIEPRIGASDNSPDALGVILRIGGISAFIAFILALRLARILKSKSR